MEILELQSWHWSDRWHDEFEREWICQPIYNWVKFFQKLHLKSLYAYSSDPNNSLVLNKPVGGIFFSVFIGENACLWENFTTYLRHSLEILELQSWHWSDRWHDEFEREWICQPIYNWVKFFQKLHLKSLYAYSSDPNNSLVLNKPVGGIFFSVFIGENACLWENFTTYLRHSLEILELQSWHWSVRWHDEFEREWICQPIWGRVDSNSRCISHTRTTPRYFPLVLKKINHWY